MGLPYHFLYESPRWLLAIQPSSHGSKVLQLPFLDLDIRDAQVFALLPQILYCLLCGHWARLHRHSLERGGGSDGTVSQFNTKGSPTEFQVLKALTCSPSYPANLLL